MERLDLDYDLEFHQSREQRGQKKDKHVNSFGWFVYCMNQIIMLTNRIRNEIKWHGVHEPFAMRQIQIPEACDRDWWIRMMCMCVGNNAKKRQFSIVEVNNDIKCKVNPSEIGYFLIPAISKCNCKNEKLQSCQMTTNQCHRRTGDLDKLPFRLSNFSYIDSQTIEYSERAENFCLSAAYANCGNMHQLTMGPVSFQFIYH